jgi:hypothetical protein
MTTLTTSYLPSPLSSLPPSPLKLFSFTHFTTNNIRRNDKGGEKRKFNNMIYNHNPDNVMDPLPSLLINYQSKDKKIRKEEETVDELNDSMFAMSIDEKYDVDMKDDIDKKEEKKDDLIKSFIEFIGTDKIEEFIKTFLEKEKKKEIKEEYNEERQERREGKELDEREYDELYY